MSKAAAAGIDAQPPAGPPARRRADRRRVVSSDRDRLLTMLIMAALLHGLVILGVRFSASVGGGADEGVGMEVLLVSDELPESRTNEDARYLAQRTQRGSGNVTERVAARLPGAPPQPETPAAPAVNRPPSETAGDAALVTPNGRFHTEFSAQPLPEPAASEGLPALPTSADADTQLALRGPRRDELTVSADTRSSDLAPYLLSWKRRVERVGTVNYPSAAQRQGLSGNPVVEVVLQADGRLREASIRRSSGHAEIDAAALAILKLASPFDAFPADLAGKHDTLRFAYEWQFQEGRLRGSVSVP
ncbi:MAG: TonB family protein [Steroidobacteraceae bacterium]